VLCYNDRLIIYIISSSLIYIIEFIVSPLGTFFKIIILQVGVLELRVGFNLLDRAIYISSAISREFELSNNKRFKLVGCFFY
jgi:hypothetical protein